MYRIWSLLYEFKKGIQIFTLRIQTVFFVAFSEEKDMGETLHFKANHKMVIWVPEVS